jgi:hypothetical protein
MLIVLILSWCFKLHGFHYGFCLWFVQIYWPLNISMLGVSIQTCRHSARHLVMHKEDCALFDIVLSLLHDTIPIPNSCGTLAHATSIVFDKKNMSRRWQGTFDWVREITLSLDSLYIVWHPWLEKCPLEVYHLQIHCARMKMQCDFFSEFYDFACMCKGCHLDHGIVMNANLLP